MEAQDKNIKVVSYPEFIYEISKEKTRVVIGGSHGKTTITAMVMHVLNSCGIESDYMVGAQLEGFDTMVHLTDDNDFIILEGDEYLASVIDKRPKFHLYKPNIALISGISWDHINVFPSKENYKEQFKIFLDSIIDGGVLVYNGLDEDVKQVSEDCQKSIRKLEYSMPEYEIINGQTFLISDEGKLPLKIFGDHNLSNLSGAKLICQLIGIQDDQFFGSIISFTGAKKRLEPLLEMNDRLIIKDFAHSPSKVMATTTALKKQFQKRKLIALLELHTFSSLNKNFIKEYANTLNSADLAILFYDPNVVLKKGYQLIDNNKLKQAFNNQELYIFSESKMLTDFILKQKYVDTNLLFMSSGNYASIDLDMLINEIKSSK